MQSCLGNIGCAVRYGTATSVGDLSVCGQRCALSATCITTQLLTESSHPPTPANTDTHSRREPSHTNRLSDRCVLNICAMWNTAQINNFTNRISLWLFYSTKVRTVCTYGHVSSSLQFDMYCTNNNNNSSSSSQGNKKKNAMKQIN